MEVNRHNYEAYLLDLIEGRLSVEDQQRLHDFLRLNPDCSAEPSELEPWFLEPAHIHYPDKRGLKRQLPEVTSILTGDNFDLFSIARMEGDLTPEQEAAHRKMVSEEDQKHELWSEWQRTKLVSEHIEFKDKKSLVRRKGLSKRMIWMSLISAAATVAMLVILIRMEPVSSTGEFSLQSPPEAPAQKLREVTAQPENQAVQAASSLPVQKPAAQEISVLPVQKSVKPVLPSEAVSVSEVAPKDDLMPRPVRIKENRAYISSLVGNPVPDQIEPLPVPPATIHLRSLSVAQLSEMDLREVVKDYREEKDLSFWSIASTGIKGINKVTGSDISLLAARDEEGEVSGFQLKSKRFSLTRPLGRED